MHISKLFLVAIAHVLVGCKLPPPDGCAPNTTRCNGSTPQVCSATQRWTQIMQPCVNSVCCEVPGVLTGRIIHSCAQQSQCVQSDGGAE